ncbi:nucleotide-binding protein [Rhodobacter sp. Har01]|uniref:TIR domain-containing protein n=1 Tax=Rhodobacter sp. Har01 TaxID=2883999 RepID=UPI001D08E7F5|nr:TIR domain-containing protein [Rhodobacter sp. Har01]MCB6177008.1 nucleotide-binding protein [Rhodobacter sp. Har01]
MKLHEELFSIAERLEGAATDEALKNAEPALEKLEKAATEAGRAFSGSWQGYHANVYYKGLQPPPPGAHFSQEWGLLHTFGSLGSKGDWEEQDPIKLASELRKKAGKPDMAEILAASQSAIDSFKDAKSEIESILASADTRGTDQFLSKLRGELEKIEPMTAGDVVQSWAPTGTIMTRDTVTFGQGTRVPPHKVILAEVASIRHSFGICASAAKIAWKAGSHMERTQKNEVRQARIGTNVFIGHGRSPLWRELKDFVQDRLHLPWDEFNRVPVAGVTNQTRLSEMLDAAAIAFVIMTAEDETAEGAMQARMNVIHEVGLFQGRLGFTRAIVLLESGCTEFSNIQGLGQIRFPTGNIGACFEEVRRVLEREGLAESA